jgi:hypothetical protein
LAFLFSTMSTTHGEAPLVGRADAVAAGGRLPERATVALALEATDGKLATAPSDASAVAGGASLLAGFASLLAAGAMCCVFATAGFGVIGFGATGGGAAVGGALGVGLAESAGGSTASRTGATTGIG